MIAGILSKSERNKPANHERENFRFLEFGTILHLDAE
jgi:hypothetical protein